MKLLRYQSEVYSLSSDGTVEIIFKVKMDVGQITLDNFADFLTEATRLGIRFEDRNYFFDESPEVPGLMAWMLTYGGKSIPFIQKNSSHGKTAS